MPTDPCPPPPPPPAACRCKLHAPPRYPRRSNIQPVGESIIDSLNENCARTLLLVNNTRGDWNLRLLILSLLTVWNPFVPSYSYYLRAFPPRVHSANIIRRIRWIPTTCHARIHASSPRYGNRDRNKQACVHQCVHYACDTVLIVW